MTQIEGSQPQHKRAISWPRRSKQWADCLDFISKIDESQMQEMRLREVALP